MSNQPNVTWYNLEDVLKTETESKQVAYLLLKSTSWYANELILERIIRSVVGEWTTTQQMHKTKEFEKEPLEADFKTIVVTRYPGSSELALYTIDRMAARLGWDKSKLQFHCHNAGSNNNDLEGVRLPKAIISFEIAAQIIAELHRYKPPTTPLIDLESLSKSPRDNPATIIEALQHADYVLQVENSVKLFTRACLLFFSAGHMHVINEHGDRLIASYPLQNKIAFKSIANSVYQAYESTPDVYTVLNTLVVNGINVSQSNENVWVYRLDHARILKFWHETNNQQKVPLIKVVEPYMLKGGDESTNANFLAKFKWTKTIDDVVVFIRETDNGMSFTTIDSLVFKV